VIEIERLTVQYGKARVLDNLSLHLHPGELVLLTGPSGCGKTTLARAISGLIPHALPARLAGRVSVAGLDTQEHPLPKLATRVGLVLQNPAAQLFGTTVEEEIGLGPLNLGLDDATVAERVRWALEAVGIAHLSRRTVRNLSGGEQQRVAIAATLAMRPSVLLLDEPSSNLDAKGTDLLLSVLRSLRDEHDVTILVIEHRPERFASLADRVLVMKTGNIIADGRPDEVFAGRDLLARVGIRFPWHVPGQHWEDVLPSGRMTPPPADVPLVGLEGLRAGYNRSDVLRDVELALYPGEFAALVGENGAGKSTLARVLAGLLKPRRGRVRWGAPTRHQPRVGLVLQDPLVQLLCDTVEEEIAFGPRNYGRLGAGKTAALLREADLEAQASRGVLSLSSGQQQRLVVAAIAALEPQLLVVDEPTLGQDWAHLSQMIEFLQQLNRQGTSILLITHDAKLICRYARRVIVLENGRIVADGPPRRPRPTPAQETAGAELDCTRGSHRESA
jgi:energy-coupling factor transport system ATP-binding protein